MEYSTLTKNLLNDISKNKNVISSVSTINKKIRAGNATFGDVSKLAKSLSVATSRGLKSNVPVENIGAFAEQVVAPVYIKAQRTVLSYGNKVQKELLKKSKLGIEPVNVETDMSRIKHIVQRFKEADSIDSVSFLLNEDVSENILKSAVTDTIKSNAQRFSDLGLETYVTRSDGSGCCDWCASMVGTYRLNDIPSDFWAVHKGCSCTFEYKANGKHQMISFSTNEKGYREKVTTNI